MTRSIYFDITRFSKIYLYEHNREVKMFKDRINPLLPPGTKSNLEDVLLNWI